MDACYEYEQSIILSDGNVVSRDLAPYPGDHAINKVDEGALSPTTLCPDEESDSSKGKGPSTRIRIAPRRVQTTAGVLPPNIQARLRPSDLALQVM